MSLVDSDTFAVRLKKRSANDAYGMKVCFHSWGKNHPSNDSLSNNLQHWGLGKVGVDVEGRGAAQSEV